jgi:sugar phosphate isomerase/epimerase
MQYAICNELFEDLSLEKACKIISDNGFKGVELAPYTLSDAPDKMGLRARSAIKKILEDLDLQFVGFHWLLNAPAGLHLTTPDSVVRKKTWDFMKFLVEFCAEMGGGILVLGSGKKRNADGIPVEKALVYLTEGLRELAAFAESGKTTILIEPLSARITNVVNTLKEAEDLIHAIDHPAVSGIFDFHNCTEEKQSWPELIECFKDSIRHVHFNEIDGGYPGSGNSDYTPAFEALKRCGYCGWISLEVFDQKESPETILRKTRRTIQNIERRLHCD